ITGVVRNVKRTESKGQIQSLMEIVWLAPASQGKIPHSLSFTLDAVTGTVNGVVAVTNNVGATTVGAVDTLALMSSTRAAAPSNPALLSMPSVVPVDQQ